MPAKKTEAIDKSTRLKVDTIYDRVPTTQGDVKPGGAGSQFRIGVKKDLEGTKGKLLGAAAGEAITAGVGGLALEGVKAGLGAVRAARAARAATEARPSTTQTVNDAAAEYLDKIYKQERGAGRTSTISKAPRQPIAASTTTGRTAAADTAEIAKLRAAEKARPANVAATTAREQAIERAKAQAAYKSTFAQGVQAGAPSKVRPPHDLTQNRTLREILESEIARRAAANKPRLPNIDPTDFRKPLPQVVEKVGNITRIATSPVTQAVKDEAERKMRKK